MFHKRKNNFLSKKYEKNSDSKKKDAEQHKGSSQPRPLFGCIGDTFSVNHIIRIMFHHRTKFNAVSSDLFHNSKHSFPLIEEIVSTKISIALLASRKSHIST